MARSRSRRTRNRPAQTTTAHQPAGRSPSVPATATWSRRWALLGLGFVVAVTVLVGGAAALSVGPFAPPAAEGADDGLGAAVVQGVGGRWSEVTVDELDAMMAARDFTLLNVKTPYIGEIDGTDLYIPYDQLIARAGELPVDKAAKLVVYCRTGNQSGIAAQILLDLGYTNVVNVDGGMVAWAEGGRPIVQRDRS